jgi:hypothetical protein
MGLNSKKFHCGFYVSGRNGWRREMTRSPDMWGPGVSEGGRGSVPVREKGRMGRGPPLVLGRNGAPGLFIILFYFLLFFFCFLYFFYRFCKNAPNQFKPLS